VDKIDVEWRDICERIGCSGLATWDYWIALGGPEKRYV
jgi:hypothetical protein